MSKTNTALTSATTPLDGTEGVYVVQGGNSRKTVTGSFYIPGGTDVPVLDGGTGASTAGDARTNLGLVIGTDVQAHSAVLDATTASFTTALETKLDGIEALADVTDATNVDAAGAVMNADTSTAAMAFVIDEDNMASDSATVVPTQQSVKAYADTKQPLNANLTTLAAVTPGATGLALLATATVAAADAVFTSGRLGSTATISSDLNTPDATGWYRTDGSSTNGPSLGIAWVLHQRYDANVAMQLWRAIDTTVGTWIRRKNGGTWGSWARVPEKLSDQTTWLAAQAVTPSALTDGATITPNLTLSNIFTVTLGGNRTLANPSSKVVGQGVTFIIRQDGTGSRTLAYGTQYKWPGGVAPTLSTAANSIDVISGLVVSSTEILCNITQAFA